MIRSTRIRSRCAPLLCAAVLLMPAVAAANCSLLAGNAAATPDSRFSDNGNGTITDTGTALMWTKAPIAGGPYTQSQAQTQADAVIKQLYKVELMGGSKSRLAGPNGGHRPRVERGRGGQRPRPLRLARGRCAPVA